jgi:putative membrane protein
MLNSAVALLIGISIGLIAGIIPGIHINLFIPLFSLMINGILDFTTMDVAILIISAVTTSIFFEFLRSTFIGIPNEITSLSVLPAHRLTLKGYGLKAVKLCIYGALFSILIASLLSPIFIKLTPIIYYNARGLIPIFLFLISVHLILKENGINKKLIAIMIFLLSGIVGYVTLNLIKINEPLFPLLTGFFGISSIITNLKEGVRIKGQKKKFRIGIKRERVLNIVTTGSISSILLGFLPTVSPSQISIIADEIVKKENSEEYLLSVSSITSSYIIASLITFFTINKARIGALTVLKGVLNADIKNLFILLFVCILTSIFSFLLVSKLASFIAKVINKIDYKKLSTFVLALVIFLVIMVSSYIGLLLLFISTMIGYITIKSKIKRVNCMGCLIIPTMFFYLS